MQSPDPVSESCAREIQRDRAPSREDRGARATGRAIESCRRGGDGIPEVDGDVHPKDPAAGWSIDRNGLTVPAQGAFTIVGVGGEYDTGFRLGIDGAGHGARACAGIDRACRVEAIGGGEHARAGAGHETDDRVDIDGDGSTRRVQRLDRYREPDAGNGVRATVDIEDGQLGRRWRHDEGQRRAVARRKRVAAAACHFENHARLGLRIDHAGHGAAIGTGIDLAGGRAASACRCPRPPTVIPPCR